VWSNGAQDLRIAKPISPRANRGFDLRAEGVAKQLVALLLLLYGARTLRRQPRTASPATPSNKSAAVEGSGALKVNFPPVIMNELG